MSSYVAQWSTAFTSPHLLQAVIENFREQELGGRVFTCMTGSAPTAPEVVDFLRDALIVPIYEGYGSTECGEGHRLVSSLPSQLQTLLQCILRLACNMKRSSRANRMVWLLQLYRALVMAYSVSTILCYHTPTRLNEIV